MKKLFLICIVFLMITGCNATNDIADYEVGIIERVIDGDTIICEIDGTGQSIRMIGMNTPEIEKKHPVTGVISKEQPFGEAAAEYTRSLLSEGTIVYLESDVGNVDRYDRLLRYVYFNESDIGNIEKSLNAQLLINGLASTMTIEPNVKYKEQLWDIEKEAQNIGLGIWNTEGSN